MKIVKIIFVMFLLLSFVPLSMALDVPRYVAQNKTVTLYGSWSASPSNLNKVVDNNTGTPTTQGYTEARQQGQSYISINLNGSYNITSIYRKFVINAGTDDDILKVYVSINASNSTRKYTVVTDTLDCASSSCSLETLYEGTTSNNYSSMQYINSSIWTTNYGSNIYWYEIKVIASVPNSVPSTPQISFPLNNSRYINNLINFTWNQSIDEYNDPIIYDFWLSNISDFSYTINRTNFTNIYTGNIETDNGIVYYAKIRAIDNYYGYSNWSNVIQFTEQNDYNLEAMTPTNGSTVTTPVTFTWREWYPDLPHTLYIATDNQYINIVSTSTISSGTYENFTTNISGLSTGTHWWKVKNNSGYYTDSMNFTISGTVPTPGRFNISVYDGSNLSLMIKNYTIQLYNTTNIISKDSNTTTGWCNFSTEIASGEYLIIVDPTGTYDNYYQRMVLANSPGNVTMYVPNSTAYTIDSVSFALLDVTGRFPYQTSTITVSRGGLVRDKSYFGLDGTHLVYLTHGKNYQITIQNGDNIFNFDNYVAYASGTSQITINDFSVNTTQLNPFRYNISVSPTAVTLNWNDIGGVLSQLNFTVRNLTSRTQVCNLVTSVGHGQSVCGINNQAAFQTIFSAKLTDGTFMNQTLYTDYTSGVRKSTTGTNPIDGSPMGIGFKFNYGTFTMPSYVYTWISLILFVLLMGSFGAQFSGFGAIIAGLEMIFFEYIGWFNPLGNTDPNNVITMALTGILTIFAVLYFLQHKERGG